jgi:hypothetical protein
MAITVLYADLRTHPSQLIKFSAEWEPNMTVKEVIKKCLGESKAQTIEEALSNNDHEIIVSWWHKLSGAISEIGGIGTTLSPISNDSVLTITYENANTTQAQIDESIEWSLKQDI